VSFQVQNRVEKDLGLVRWIGAHVTELTLKIDWHLDAYLGVVATRCGALETLRIFCYWEEIPGDLLRKLAERYARTL
jgi:hypothetical protein